MTDLLHLARPGATFAARVTSGARRAGPELVGEVIRISVTAPPEGGRATETARDTHAGTLGI